MKKAVLLLAIVLMTGSVFAQKIGYVNSQTILEQLPEAIKVQSDLDAMIANWQTKLDSMNTDLQQAYASYQQQAGNMPEDKRQATEQEILLKQQRLEQYRQSKFAQPNGEVFIRQEQMFEPIRAKIIEAIKAVSKKEGMSFVFDKTETLPLILHADDQYDITFEVLNKLKRGK
ncbi:MAG: hypothetical protein SCALA702_10070 [Melioribacteraceae bacterium]|nr:MAG: hypothetical protein SCALA702_10070 [Melioribacteraceae bacterium]